VNGFYYYWLKYFRGASRVGDLITYGLVFGVRVRNKGKDYRLRVNIYKTLVGSTHFDVRPIRGRDIGKMLTLD
jgi:hypothetical protein